MSLTASLTAFILSSYTIYTFAINLSICHIICNLSTVLYSSLMILLQLKGEYICQNIYFLSPISLNGERFALTITQLSVVVVVKELPGQRVRHIGDDCLVVGHAGDSKNWKYAKQYQTFIFINYIHSTHPQKYSHFF